MYRHVRYFLFLVLVLQSCKDDKFISDDKISNEFDAEGKTFSYNQFSSTSWPLVTVQILPNSVNSKNYLEYYTMLLENDTDIDSFYVNFLRSDINVFRSSAQSLSQNAQLTIPFPSSITYATVTGYLPYKIKITDNTNIYSQLNDPSLWTPIVNFTYDNTAKTMTFGIDDLNAYYVIAKHR
jgi:hypothetical protein